ncbi:DUF6049 family protein [Rhabdothermincola sp.]|uniref:DUF6049 family protein n=1 Tax=Rhabdothermincola sp. TaxID=2820405 RepID=UPI002FE3F838
MTPSTGRTRRPALRSAPLLVALAAILASLGLGTTGPFAEAGVTPEPAGPARLELVDQTAWVAPEGTFELTLRIPDPPPGARIAVAIHPATPSRTRFEQSIRGENLGAPLRPGPPAWPLDTLAAGDGTYRIVVPVSAVVTPPFGVRLGSPGVYPVSVAVTDHDGDPVTQLVTHLVRLPPSGSAGVPLAVSVIAPLEAGSPFRPDGSVRLDREDRERLGNTIAALATTVDVPLTVAPSPEVIDALAVAEQQGEPDLLGPLARSLGARQVLPRPYAAIDLPAWARGSQTDPDTDIGLTRQLATGSEVVAALLGTWPDQRTWLADHTIDGTALGRLRAAGVSQLVLPADRFDDEGGRGATADHLAFEVRDSEGETLRAVQTDPSLAERLLATSDPVLNAHLVLADLAVLALERPSQSRGAVLSPPARFPIPRASWDALLKGLARRPPPGADPLVSPVTLDDLFRAVDIATTGRAGTRSPLVRQLAPTVSEGDVSALAAASAATWSRIESFASMLEPPTPAPPGAADSGTDQGAAPANAARELVWPMRRLALAAGASDLDEPARDAFLAAADAAVQAQLAAITLPGPQQITLTERTSRVPLTFENQLDHAVTVEVALQSEKLEFPDGDLQLLMLPPKETTRYEITVETRSSGAFPLEVTVRSPDRGLVLGATRFSVRSTAISGIGLLLSAVAGAFLLLWWARHFRDVRRSRRLVSPNHPASRPVSTPRSPSPGAGSATLPRAAGAEGAASGGDHARSPDRH